MSLLNPEVFKMGQLRNRVKAGSGGGFSLLEITVMMAVLAVLGVVSLRGAGGQSERASSEAVARILASEMESARMRAMREGHPVAFCFPSDNGATPLSQSFYVLEGESVPVMTSRRLLAADCGDTVIATVYWGSATLDQAETDQSWAADRKQVASWLGNRAGNDYALVFLPNGSVVSNDLPMMDNSYRIVASTGLTARAGAPSGTRRMAVSPRTYQLIEAFGAQTVSVTTRGEITVNSGLIGPVAGQVVTHQPALTLPIARAKEFTALADTSPTIESIAVNPEPVINPKATVKKERNLTLTTVATDADGDLLNCTWTATPVGAAVGTGAFSLGDNHRMVWDPEISRWTSHVTWAPPPTCNVGDQFVLTCTVADANSNVDVRTETILDPVTIAPPGRIVFKSNPNTAVNYDTYSVNPDGTDLRLLVGGANGDLGHELSPDGTKIVYALGSPGAGSPRDIWISGVDGNNRTKITSSPIRMNRVRWTPSGNRVLAMDPSVSGMVAVNVDGSGRQRLPGSINRADPLAFAPDSNILVFETNGGSRLIYAAEYVDDGVSPPSLRDVSNLTGTGRSHFAGFIPTTTVPEFLYRTSFPNAACRAELIDTGVAGSSRFQLQNVRTTTGGTITLPIFSLAGDQMVTNGMRLWDWIDDGTPLPNAGMTAVRLSSVGGVNNPIGWTPVP